jgi:hypothetical protein
MFQGIGGSLSNVLSWVLRYTKVIYCWDIKQNLGLTLTDLISTADSMIPIISKILTISETMMDSAHVILSQKANWQQLERLYTIYVSKDFCNTIPK